MVSGYVDSLILLGEGLIVVEDEAADGDIFIAQRKMEPILLVDFLCLEACTEEIFVGGDLAGGEGLGVVLVFDIAKYLLYEVFE